MATVAMRSALERLGFTAQAASAITDAQGIDSLDELRVLDDSKVENLCKVVRHPGGVDAGRRADNGHQVSLRAENNLKLACFYVRHQHRVSRVPQATGITLESVRALRQLKENEKAHEEPGEAPKIDATNWPKTLEALEEYLRGHLGVTKVLLSYVVRATVEVPPANANPADGTSNSPYEMV